MAARQVKTPVSQLEIGMYVSSLDRPWVETPFPIQGFYIRDHKDVEALQAYCRFVYVEQQVKAKTASFDAHATQSGGGRERSIGQVFKLPPIVIQNPERYDVTVPLKKEAVVAEKLQTRVREAIRRLVDRLGSGQAIDLDETQQIAGAMVESVIRNPDAMLWLSRLQGKSSFAYQHAINASIWALVFGRHLGLKRDLLKTLATGVLLSQVGKVRLPQELLDKQGMLKPDEFTQYKAFVELGVEILSAASDISKPVVSVVEFHRERHNGSGFPKGITGEKIPLLGKIAGIVDHYQEMIEPRPGVQPLTSLEAVSRLYDARNIEFQEDLVERFIQAIGVYPTGTLVELSNQQVGIVVANNPGRRLWPKVMLLLDAKKQPLKQAKVVDLVSHNEHVSKDQKLNISGSLPVGAYEIDSTRFQVTGATSRWSWQHLAG